MSDRARGWALLRAHVEPLPWDSWRIHDLAQQQFWTVLADRYGNAVALRCFDRLHLAEGEPDTGSPIVWDGDLPGYYQRLAADAFPECAPEWAELWHIATEDDAEFRWKRAAIKYRRLRALYRRRLFLIVQPLRLLPATDEEGFVLADEAAAWNLVDVFMTSRGWFKRGEWGGTLPPKEKQDEAVRAVKRAWRLGRNPEFAAFVSSLLDESRRVA